MSLDFRNQLHMHPNRKMGQMISSNMYYILSLVYLLKWNFIHCIYIDKLTSYFYIDVHIEHIYCIFIFTYFVQNAIEVETVGL